jgi:peptide/nickel transport system permease protein
MTALQTATAPGAPAMTATDDGITKKRAFGIAGWVAMGWMTIIGICVLFAQWLPIKDPNASKAGYERLAPFQTWEFPLGCDANGRDLLSRTIYGARTSMVISVSAVAIGFLIGGLLGLLAGYFRNWFSTVLAGLFDILLAIPALVLVLSLVAVLKGDPNNDAGFHMPSTLVVTIALGLVSIPILARITRASTLSWAKRDFVTAAKAQGGGNRRILFREILPNVFPAMASISLLGIAVAVVAEGGAAILGASVDPPTSTWGTLIASGRSDLREAPFIVAIPTIAIFLTVTALNYLGDVITDRLEVRESAL